MNRRLFRLLEQLSITAYHCLSVEQRVTLSVAAWLECLHADAIDPLPAAYDVILAESLAADWTAA